MKKLPYHIRVSIGILGGAILGAIFILGFVYLCTKDFRLATIPFITASIAMSVIGWYYIMSKWIPN